MGLEDKKVGDSFEIDGVHYVVVDHGKRQPKSHQRMWPQPDEVGDEYIHSDGHIHICANTRCPKLVPATKNPGKPRIYCDNDCNRKVQARKNDAKRNTQQYLLYDPLGRLFAVISVVHRSTIKAKHALDRHLNDPEERCPEATEQSNFVCPSVHNQNYYSEAKWAAWHQPGEWPGACLIAASLKDQYRLAYYLERGDTTCEKEYTQCRGPQWRWKDENEMLPLPAGIVRG